MGRKKRQDQDELDTKLGQSIMMQWIETLRQLSGKSLRSFARSCSTSHTTLTELINKDRPSSNRWMKTICLMRRESGLTGNQIFKLWDKLYLDDETKTKP
jgi:hypothetical protein